MATVSATCDDVRTSYNNFLQSRADSRAAKASFITKLISFVATQGKPALARLDGTFSAQERKAILGIVYPYFIGKAARNKRGQFCIIIDAGTISQAKGLESFALLPVKFIRQVHAAAAYLGRTPAIEKVKNQVSASQALEQASALLERLGYAQLAEAVLGLSIEKA